MGGWDCNSKCASNSPAGPAPTITVPAAPASAILCFSVRTTLIKSPHSQSTQNSNPAKSPKLPSANSPPLIDRRVDSQTTNSSLLLQEHRILLKMPNRPPHMLHIVKSKKHPATCEASYSCFDVHRSLDSKANDLQPPTASEPNVCRWKPTPKCTQDILKNPTKVTAAIKCSG